MRGLPRPCLCLVTDRHQVRPDARTSADEFAAMDDWLDEAIDAGIDLIQVRERDVETRVLVSFVRRLVERAGPALVLVNDRADVARAAGADGVHLPSHGPEAARVRALGPGGWTIGRSIHDAAGAGRDASVDYVLFGTVFPSRSKPPGSSTSDLDGLSAAIGRARVPVVAIGGMTPERARACAAVGAAGIAAIGAFLPAGRRPDALGPRAAVAAFRAAFGDEGRANW